MIFQRFLEVLTVKVVGEIIIEANRSECLSLGVRMRIARRFGVVVETKMKVSLS